MQRRQIWAVQNLELPPRDMGYVLTKFSVEEWGNVVAVIREYRNPTWKTATMSYHECIKVGSRGAVTVIYSNLY